MIFFNAWAFGFAAIIPVIVVLYLLKLRRRPLPVSTLMFWQRVIEENVRRALFQRLRQWFSLLLHLIIFALILLALARPSFDRSLRSGSSTVLILDDRMRMQAVEPDGEARLAKAIRAASALARQASPARQMAVLGTAGSPAVRVPFSGDEKVLKEALLRTRATDAGGNLQAAIALARDLLASRSGEKRIVVFTDRPAPISPALKPSVPSEIVALGSARDNVAITRFAARPVPANPATAEIFLQIHNFGRGPSAGNVEFELDGRLLDVKPYRLGPGEEQKEIFSIVPPTGKTGQEPGRGWLTARLDARDALAADNIAYAVLPSAAPRRVLLVTKGNWFLEKLLEADASVRFELLAPDAFQLEMAGQFDAVILDNALPPGFDIAHAAGNFFFLVQTPFTVPGPPVDQPIVTDLDSSHPALRLVNMEHVSLAHAGRATIPDHPTGGWNLQAPLRSFTHPLLITGTRRIGSGEQHLAALTFDLSDSDLPLRVAFPLLMSNTIHWLAGERPSLSLSAKAGESLTLPAGETIQPSPASPSSSSPEAGVSSIIPRVAGFYRVNRPAGPAWMAVNAFDEAESDLSAPSPASPSPPAPRLRALALLPAGWPLWPYLALAAIGLFTLEWRLFHRRQTE